MNRYEYGRRYRRRRRRRKLAHTVTIIGCTALIGVGAAGAILFGKHIWKQHTTQADSYATASVAEKEANAKNTEETTSLSSSEAESETTVSADAMEDLLHTAERLALGYDYEQASALLQGSDFSSETAVTDAIASYTEKQAGLVRKNISEVTHVFFHSLVVDNEKAFDGDEDTPGYNQVMTTVKEFKLILESMYEKGYVLVRMHDLAYETTDEDGNTVMKAGDILLPEDKLPFVMSQDDVCYYPYMTGDGFANRIVIGADGYPTCEMKLDDGTVSVGSYDLVPILEDFIKEHPDFSYKGARAVIAFTGYEGVLGYRTADSYKDSETYAEDVAAAKEVAQCLRDHGWELASHSWGHLNMGSVSWERFQTDADKWEREVESIIGDTDIILFPFGADINDWHPYTHENERFDYFYKLGFRYFCNVDSSRYWVQLGKDYLRQGRRNLDGYRMWKDITAEDPSKRKLDDLFRAEDVFDSDRPTPVPEM